MFSSNLDMENTEKRGPGIENGEKWLNKTVHFDQTGPTEKNVRLKRWTDFFEIFPVGPKFTEIMVKWIELISTTILTVAISGETKTILRCIASY